MNVVLGAQNILSTIVGRIGKLVKALAFDASKITFTPNMAKRNSAGPFAAGVLVQGNLMESAYSDLINLPPGNVISGAFTQNFDWYQGSIVLWITPEWNGNDNQVHKILYDYSDGRINIMKHSDNYLYVQPSGGSAMSVDISSWIAGTTYCLILRWNSNNTLDGTNHICISINDTHSFGITTSWSASVTSSYTALGSNNIVEGASALIEGLTIYRRPLFDGTYGIDVGNGDEINLIYNNGSGTDPCSVTGSWDVCFCLPTNSTAGALTTGTGEAWSHPHSSNVLQQWHAGDGYYGGGKTLKMVAGDSISYGSDAKLDNLTQNDITVEGWVKFQGDRTRVLAKSSPATAQGWYLEVFSSGGLPTLAFTINGDSDSKYALVYIWPPVWNLWYHVAGTFSNSGDRKVRLYLNGVLQNTSEALTGTVHDDSAYNLTTICTGSSIPYIGWLRVSNSIRYTDTFAPSRLPPEIDANTVVQYNMAEGSGTTIDNAEGTAACDGTITGCTWVSEWEDIGTPVECRSVNLNASHYIDCGSEASIDNLPAGEFTAEAWIDFESLGPGTVSYIFQKGATWTNGWWLRFDSSYVLTGCIISNGDFPYAVSNYVIKSDKKWHHVVMYYNASGDKKIYLAIDGIWCTYTRQDTLTGSYTVDANDNLIIGGSWIGKIGWSRISNNDRYSHGANFVPAARTNPPSNDANTIRLFYTNEGSGTVITDYSSNAQNGTLVDGTWTNSRSLDNSSGEKIYAGGYEFGTDTANEGISQQISLPNLLLNSGFTTDITNWSISGAGSLASVAGGKSGNCLQITNGSGGYNWAYQAIQCLPNARYQVSCWAKSGTTSSGQLSAGTSGRGYDLMLVGAYGADWTYYSGTFTAPVNGVVYIGLWINDPTPDLTIYFDEIAVTLLPGYDFVVRPVLHYDQNAIPKIQVLDVTNGDTVITSLTCPNQQTNLVINGDFTTNVDNWSVSGGGSYSSVAGGVSGNCMEIINAPGYSNVAQAIQGVPYARYRISGYIKAGTTSACFSVSQTARGVGDIWDANSAASWKQVSFIYTAPANGLFYVVCWMNSSTAGLTSYYDSITVTRIYDQQHPFCEPFSFELPTVARNGVAADCSAFKVQVINTATTGVISLHQVELLPNLIDNPSFETGSGDPWIPDGWIAYGALAGDLQEGIGFSGADKAIAFTPQYHNYGIRNTEALLSGNSYIGFGMHAKGGTNVSMTNIGLAGIYNHTGGNMYFNISGTGAWKKIPAILLFGGNDMLYIVYSAPEGQTTYIDNLYAIKLDSASLIVTPASLADSTEITGVRVDGYDQCSIPNDGSLDATNGIVKFKWTPRHAYNKFVNFTPVEALVTVAVDSSNFIYAGYLSHGNLGISMILNSIDLGSTLAYDYYTAANTTYDIEFRYEPGSAKLYVDGNLVITHDLGSNVLPSAPTTIYFGSRIGIYQADATFAAPE